MKRILLALSILLSATLQLAAQTAPPTNLSGEELKTWLRTNRYDGKRQVLSYDAARAQMYSFVDNYNNTVTCVYSGYAVSKPYDTANPSTSGVGRINCEHTVPQSWFDEVVRMRSDIHHLYPTYDTWNSDRGSDPFAEIPDNQTTKWVRDTHFQTSIPTSNIDEYSEDGPGKYEPREDHKGNLARAVFYFYTMHAGQNFDSGKGVISAVADLNTLYQWHLQDPVDDRERERNRRVEVAQGNRNPYIDYPELVAKAWNLTPVNCSPATQVSNLTVSQKTTTTITLNWANGSGDRRLIVVKEGAAVSFTPTGTYSGINSNYTSATDQGSGQRIVYYNSGSSVTITGLKANTSYAIQAFEACSSDNTYNTTSAPTINTVTPDYTCTGAPTAVTGVASANITQGGFNLNWANGSGDGRMVVIRKAEAPAFVPQTGTTYTGASANFATATALTDGSKLIYNGTGSEVAVTGLQAGSLYFVYVYETCSNGSQYATAVILEVTTTAANSTPTENGEVLTIQDFNGTANDGWVVTSGFNSSTLNTGFPDGQRLRSGASYQVTNTTTGPVTLELSEVNITGKQDVYLQLYNSVVATTSGNGIENSDLFEVYVALNGAAYSATPEIKITGTTTSNNIQYGMNGTATITTAAGTPVEKIFSETGPQTADKAPSILRVTIPNGTTSVKAKLVVKANSDKEVWNVEDVALIAAKSTADCDENILEGHAGEDRNFCAGSSATIGATAETGYTYSWAPATGLSSATSANPTITLTTPGTYTYTVTATINGCTSTDQVSVTVNAAPVKPVITQTANQLTASITGAAYEWKKDGATIADATSQTITITEAGNYTVRVKNDTDCYSEVSEVIVATLQPTAVEDELAKGVVVAPNPATGKFSVTTEEPLQQVEVTVTNMVGAIVYRAALPTLQNSLNIDLSNLPGGLYLVQLQAKKLRVVRKIVLTK